MIYPMSYESQEVSVWSMLKESTVGFSPLLYFEDAGTHNIVVFTDDGVQEILFLLGQLQQRPVQGKLHRAQIQLRIFTGHHLRRGALSK